MKIKDCEYRGFKYSILFADRGDWGAHLHHFHTDCDSGFDGGFSKDLDIVDKQIKGQIDEFMDIVPSSLDDLVGKISEQLVWTGYEDCHLDEKTTALLIKAYVEKTLA